MKAALISSLLAPAALLALAAPALAGNGNTLYLVQDSPPGTSNGNNFLSDQTQANYSSIGSLAAPARQSGNGNTADVTIESKCSRYSWLCGKLALVQDNTGSGNDSSQLWNMATVTISGNGSAGLLQFGSNNTATLTVENGAGAISQTGLDNEATLTLHHATTGGIVQNGVGNTASLEVNAVGWGGATLTQLGNGLQYNSPVIVDTTSSVSILMIGGAPTLTHYY